MAGKPDTTVPQLLAASEPLNEVYCDVFCILILFKCIRNTAVKAFVASRETGVKFPLSLIKILTILIMCGYGAELNGFNSAK